MNQHTHTNTHLPELVAEGGYLAVHGLAAVSEFLQLPLQLPLLGTGARVLLLHLLQLPLQLLQSDHRLIQLQEKSREEEEEGKDRAQQRGRVDKRLQEKRDQEEGAGTDI